MPREKRWSRFHVEPLALLNDPDFVRMRDLPDGSHHPLGERAQRAYVLLWLHSWQEKEPGVIPYFPRRMAELVGLTLEQFREVENLIRPAVKVRADGAWMFALMVQEHDAQNRRHRAKSTAGKQGANARWRNEQDGSAMNAGHATPSPAPAPSPSPAPATPRPSASVMASPSLRSEDAPTAPAESPRNGPPSTLGLVLGLADSKAMTRPPTPFPNDTAWRWVTQTLKPRDPRAAMEFMAWAWKHLGRDLVAIQGMVLEWREKGISNPYAYFAPGGAGGCRVDAAASDQAVAEQAAHNAADRAFLEGRG